MVINDIKPISEEPQGFHDAWTHPNEDSQKMARRNLQRFCGYEKATGRVHDLQKSYAP